MGLCAVLLICLSQAELARVWSQELSGSLHGQSDVQRVRRDQQESSRSTQNRTGQEANGGGFAIDTLPDNMTRVVEDAQKYYSWRSFGPGDKQTQELWVDLNSVQAGQVRVHGILSNTHRQAARVALSFDFPFYGHQVRQITIATGGFIFTGEITHRMLTATQYIAPLMANFDPSFSRNSTVCYLDNGEVFVVQWDKVRLQGREAEGAFTFQAALHRNGTIVFGYRDVPLPVVKINSTEHPVKVGLSDAFMAFISSPQSPESKRRTIYEYHRVEVNTTEIVNRSAFVFSPLPTCLQHTNCDQCFHSNFTTGCGWCNILQRCSDGIDRHRQEWLEFGCSEEAKEGTCEDYIQGGADSSMSPFSSPVPAASMSPATRPGSPATEDDTNLLFHHHDNGSGEDEPPEHTAIIAGVVAALVLLVFLTLLAVYYINTHPTVAPPFYLMQRRTNNYWPSMKFRNQGCHSSYAEVELGFHEKDGFIEAEQC
ncbi:plexin domain-containing protein 1 isoform X1 [Tachysurus fulvidraco]|uniref:plexin domain-containing protein 1 isoform X1 n=1 Tax=Tachysurus fulvidraco TaxID=1234273 RepID=UPI000F4FC659|nr:plexin domain-containing protein 1 isoform X1 [Tachysurus fulvidraco]